MVIVVMGVSGVGKTTIGRALAEALHADFAEGDAYHPPENVAKMKSGTPLNDDDRLPWLNALSRAIGEWLDEGRTMVLACSALKRRYRDILRAGHDGVQFVYLKGDAALIRHRLDDRRDHFMPASLLESQLEALEEPRHAIRVDVTDTPADIVPRILTALEKSDG